MDVRDPIRARKALIFVCAVAVTLQLAIAPQVSLFGGRFNFMVVLALVMAPSCDIRSAVLTGFFAGLFFDLTSPVPVGLMSLVLTIACFGLSMSSHGIGGGLSAASLRLAFGSILLVDLAYGLALYFLGVEGSILYALAVHGLASSVLDALAAVPFLMFGSGTDSNRGFTARSKGTRYKSYKSLR